MIRIRSLTLALAPMCLFALGAFLPEGAAHAVTRKVTNCNNAGAGSLRAVVASAASGDAIDLRSLKCSSIVLNGAIVVPQDDLRLLGPGTLSLTIDGNRAGRVFLHNGAGTLYIAKLSVSNGLSLVSAGDEGEGGCIRSLGGTVELWRSRVHGCEAYSPEYTSVALLGGGIAAANVTLNFSSVFENKAGIYSYGGGIYATGTARLYYSEVYGHEVTGDGGGIVANVVDASYSTIRDNTANRGGGIACQRLNLNKSTVSGNRAVLRDFLGGYTENEAGGVLVMGSGHSVVADSTISGNAAFNYSAGEFRAGTVTIYNSTITGNIENYPEGDLWHYYPPEYFGRGALHAVSIRLEGTIVAGNQRLQGVPPYDIASGTVTGSHNLIGHSQVPLPADTLTFTDPRVAPLADNGGPTRTHRLLGDSPAIDHGNNLLNRQYDQRGPGFPRTKGPATDIGSYER
ncbi:choice-of-anchor Q domain-containing protein [Lysobacter auxotrophicus]|uniref:Right-handed parallel beta-helix repeat-containing protein n=1 Tax=Lysobacter auxotrophicus TaxID=2992573 RepID=A0ABM8DD49_9GAMM|nr:choice-of-anchor Q domain-containing protein [Lysobacter auxotrophicus]BDU16524.1 right-handed parallel beta-helix repeat-containing protein [Lysobacter auxotrophicus]